MASSEENPKRGLTSSGDPQTTQSRGTSGGTLGELALKMPVKPRAANHGQALSLCSNHYKFNMGGGSRSIHKYAVKFKPELPDNSRVTGKLVNKARESIDAKLNKCFIHWGNCVYSPILV